MYKDPVNIDELTKEFDGAVNIGKHDDSDLDIELDQLLDDMNINDESERKDSLDIIKENKQHEPIKNKKQIGKRERTGKQIEDEI